MQLKPLFFLSALFIQNLFATSDPITRYLEYLEKYPHTLGPEGSYTEGEIEIIRDKEKMLEIEQLTHRQVGVVAEDKYWIWLNDAVRFPSASYGVYGRMIWRGSLEGIVGVAVMPLLENEKVALNRNFRHATRSWEYELPRGGRAPHETPEEAALRELQEETGLISQQLEYLGDMHPDSGLTNTLAPIYIAHICKETLATPEDSEAIAGIDIFTIAELKQGFLDGYLTKEIGGNLVKIPLRDPFLAFALLQWELRQ